jgi:hypothetical protein
MEQTLIEIAKLGLQIWFANMRIAGKSEEEIQKLYDSEIETFNNNNPRSLSDLE